MFSFLPLKYNYFALFPFSIFKNIALHLIYLLQSSSLATLIWGKRYPGFSYPLCYRSQFKTMNVYFEISICIVFTAPSCAPGLKWSTWIYLKTSVVVCKSKHWWHWMQITTNGKLLRKWSGEVLICISSKYRLNNF